MLSLTPGSTRIQTSCMTHRPSRADDTSTAARLELQLAAGPAPRSSGLPVLDREKRVLNQTSIHPTGREAPECRCCTWLSVNLSSFRVYLKPFMDMKVFSGSLDLGVSAPSLQALVSSAFLQVFTGITLLLPVVSVTKLDRYNRGPHSEQHQNMWSVLC